MRVIRKRLDVSEIFPPSIRYNAATDTVEFSPDGGTTWIPSPENDPRLVDHYPPPDTANPRCDAATRMTAMLQEMQAQFEASLLAGAFGAEVLTLILLMLAFIPLIGVLSAVIIGLWAQLVPLGYAAVHAAFDGFDWQGLTCKILCNLTTSGVLTDSGYSALRQQIEADYTSDQQTVLLGALDILGRAGMNDAAAVRTETGDCDECDECGWCEFLDFSESDYGFSPLSNGYPVADQANGVWESGNGWRRTYAALGSGRRTGLIIGRDIPACELTEIELVYTYTAASAPNWASGYETFRCRVNYGAQGTTRTYPTLPPASPYTESITAPTSNNIQVSLITSACPTCSSSGGDCLLTGMYLRGTGVPPGVGVYCE